MTQTSVNLSKVVEEGIQIAIKKAIDEALEEAIQTATDYLTKEVSKSVDSIALSVMQFYSIQDMGTEIRITVKKDLEQSTKD